MPVEVVHARRGEESSAATGGSRFGDGGVQLGAARHDMVRGVTLLGGETRGSAKASVKASDWTKKCPGLGNGANHHLLRYSRKALAGKHNTAVRATN